jgi:hypothetical protein
MYETIYKTEIMMIVKIPHIRYYVIVKKIRKNTKPPLEGATAWIECPSENESIIHLPSPLKVKHFPVLAHEIVHILKNICIARHMNFTEESEHMAYLMQYIFGKITGYNYAEWY